MKTELSCPALQGDVEEEGKHCPLCLPFPSSASSLLPPACLPRGPMGPEVALPRAQLVSCFSGPRLSAAGSPGCRSDLETRLYLTPVLRETLQC